MLSSKKWYYHYTLLLCIILQNCFINARTGFTCPVELGMEGTKIPFRKLDPGVWDQREEYQDRKLLCAVLWRVFSAMWDTTNAFEDVQNCFLFLSTALSILHSTDGISPQYLTSPTVLNILCSTEHPLKYGCYPLKHWTSSKVLNTIQCTDGIPLPLWEKYQDRKPF